MKKLLIALSFVVASLGPWRSAFAEDLITSTLLDHVTTVTQFRSGETNLALLDSVVRIGNVKGRSIFDIQAGFSGETKPEPGEATAANFVVSGLFKVSSLIKDKIDFPEQWEFLRSIEHGLAVTYDFREKDEFVSYQVGLAFSLKPKQ